jgi:tetratricopeptide (TPR) repeat protein
MGAGKPGKEQRVFRTSHCARPKYALAWYGLAYAHYHMGYFGFMRPMEANAQCARAARKTLELDEMLPEAHTMMAVLWASEFDWAGAGLEFGRALKIAPESEEVWANYDFYYLVSMGRLEEALAASKKAVELDPLSAFLRWRLGLRYRLTRQWDRALQQDNNALELDPNYYMAHLSLGMVYVATRRFGKGIRACETAIQLTARSSFALAYLGFAYASAGRLSEAQKILGELEQNAQKAYAPPSHFAHAYLRARAKITSHSWRGQGVVPSRQSLMIAERESAHL